MSDIFVSYAAQDRARVKPVVDCLASAGWSVWWDRSLLAGTPFTREIETALNEAGCVVVFWSTASVQSDWVLAEAEEGRRRGVLIPVLLDDVKPPLVFRVLHEVRAVGNSGNLTETATAELLNAVKSALHSSAPGPEPIDSGSDEAGQPVMHAGKLRPHQFRPLAEIHAVWRRVPMAGRRFLGWGAIAGLVVAGGLGWYGVNSYRNDRQPSQPVQVSAGGPRAGNMKDGRPEHQETAAANFENLKKQPNATTLVKREHPQPDGVSARTAKASWCRSGVTVYLRDANIAVKLYSDGEENLSGAKAKLLISYPSDPATVFNEEAFMSHKGVDRDFFLPIDMEQEIELGSLGKYLFYLSDAEFSPDGSRLSGVNVRAIWESKPAGT